MSAPVRGHRPSRFTFNIPSPVHVKQPKPQLPTKYPHHPAPPSSFLFRKHDILHRRKASTPHPIITQKPAATPHPAIANKLGFIDYSLSLQFSPSFSPSSCVISGVPLPDTPTSPTDSPVSEMRQRRWSVEMRRDSHDEDEQREEDEEEEDEDEEHNIMSPDMMSSSSCSFLSPLDSASSLDTPITSPPASVQPPANSKSSPRLLAPLVPVVAPHRRIHSDPLPASSTSPVSSLAFKLNLRPLFIPPSKGDNPIVMLSTDSPMPLCKLTARQYSYECDEQPSGAGQAAGAAVSELMHGRPTTLAECWYGRSEMMSPVSGASMMYMAAQQNKSQQLPFSNFYSATAVL